MPKPIGANQISAALAYFNHVRVPACLIAGLSAAGLFTAIPQGSRGKRAHDVLSTVYIGLLAAAAVLHLTCVFVSTATGVRVMAGGFDPHATSAVIFLRREFEFSYLWTGLSFFSGLESYVCGLAIRAYTSLPGAAGRVSALLLLATASGMVAYANQMLVTYSSVGESAARLIELLLHEVLLRSYAGYVSLGLSALAMASLASNACAFLFGAQPPTSVYSKPKAA